MSVWVRFLGLGLLFVLGLWLILLVGRTLVGWGWSSLVVYAIAMGVAMTGLVMVGRFVISIVSGPASPPGSIRAFSRVRTSKSFDEVFNASVDALSSIGRKVKIEHCNHEKGKILARKAMGLRNWGESLCILVKKSDNETIIEVESKPTPKFVVRDSGVNARNVERITAS